MERVKKHKPLGVCSVCRALTEQHAQVNHRCVHVVNGRRCYGIFKSGLVHVWDECLTCGASGRVGTQICTACNGFGWHLIA